MIIQLDIISQGKSTETKDEILKNLHEQNLQYIKSNEKNKIETLNFKTPFFL